MIVKYKGSNDTWGLIAISFHWVLAILLFIQFASGIRLSTLGNGTLEAENAKIRGTLSTTVFEKETVNAVGGQLLVGNSTVITGSGGFSGVTASVATMSVENVSGFTGSYNGFNTAGAVSDIDSVDGEILILKKVEI